MVFTVGKRSIEDFDESTKVHSSEQLDEILRQAQAREAEDPNDVNRDFEDYAESTRIAPSEEIARAMTEAGGKLAMPAVGRVATTNVVRRSSSHIIARASDQMPSVRGSAEIERAPTPPPTDDDAFGEWDADAPKAAREPGDEPPSEKVTAKTQPLIERIPFEAMRPSEDLPLIGEPPALPPIAEVTRPSGSISIPPINVPRISRPTPMPMPMPVLEPETRGWRLRWGVLAWAALLAISIGVGSVAFIKIRRLERELAVTKIQLQQERAAKK